MPINIQDPVSGELKSYKTVSERMPAFLEAFPLSEYQVIRKHQAGFEFQSKAVELAGKALDAGFDPKTVGIDVPHKTVVIFTAELWRGDVLVMNASSRMLVISPKDWEAGETASFQRLMAACGFGGQEFDADENHDRIKASIKTVDSQEKPAEAMKAPDSAPKAKPEPQPEQKATPEPEPEQEPEPEADATESVFDEQETQAQEVTEQAPEVVQEETTDSTPEPETNSAPDAPATEQEEIRPQLLNQLKHLANLVGEDVPAVSNQKEAKAEIKRLNRLVRTAS